MTSNMHATVCHMFQSEEQAGPVYRRKELYLEQFIGHMLKGVVNRVTRDVEKIQGKHWVMSEATLKMESFAVRQGITLPAGTACYQHPKPALLSAP